MTVAGEPEVEVQAPQAAAPPSRRDAARALLAGAVFAPSAALGQTHPPSAQPASSQSPASTTASGPKAASSPGSGPESERLKTRADFDQRMTTVVHINGQGPFHFLVDTGANQSGLSAEVAAALKLPAGQPVLVHGIATAYLCQTVDVQELRVGSLRTSLANAPIFAQSDLGADGLIGLDVLHDRVVTLDFLRQEIEIARKAYSMSGFNVYGASSSTAIVPARQRFGQLTIIDSSAGKAKMTCFLDTGADQSVGNTALRQAVQARMRPEEVVNYDVLIRSVTGQSVPAIVALVPNMRIGGISFTRFGLAFADLHTFDLWGLNKEPALLVGMNLLRLFASVSIDFGQREVTFQTR